MTGDDGKREGMERVRRHCDPVWRRHADAAVIEAARLYPKLTTDDIVVMIPDHVRTHENRALGPVMQEAAKNGVIARDMMPNAQLRHPQEQPQSTAAGMALAGSTGAWQRNNHTGEEPT